MKRLFTQIAMMTLAIVGYAQSDIHFSTVKATDKNLPAEVIDALDLKMHQVLNRNSAAAADVYNVFAIEPALSLGDVLSTEGMVRNVSVAKGELVLIAKNIIDGTEYYSLTIPVEADEAGTEYQGDQPRLHPIHTYHPSEDSRLLCRQLRHHPAEGTSAV